MCPDAGDHCRGSTLEYASRLLPAADFVEPARSPWLRNDCTGRSGTHPLPRRRAYTVVGAGDAAAGGACDVLWPHDTVSSSVEANRAAKTPRSSSTRYHDRSLLNFSRLTTRSRGATISIVCLMFTSGTLLLTDRERAFRRTCQALVRLMAHAIVRHRTRSHVGRAQGPDPESSVRVPRGQAPASTACAPAGPTASPQPRRTRSLPAPVTEGVDPTSVACSYPHPLAVPLCHLSPSSVDGHPPDDAKWPDHPSGPMAAPREHRRAAGAAAPAPPRPVSSKTPGCVAGDRRPFHRAPHDIAAAQPGCPVDGDRSRPSPPSTTWLRSRHVGGRRCRSRFAGSLVVRIKLARNQAPRGLAWDPTRDIARSRRCESHGNPRCSEIGVCHL